jgi:high-affinity nickel-transport protein
MSLETGLLSSSGTIHQGSIVLIMMALIMGFRHGLDPDHLTAIDAILRFQASRKHRLVRWAGLYFSLGHGIVVMGIGLIVPALSLHWKTPAGLLLFGGLFSATFLLGMAGVNTMALVRSDSSKPFVPAGLRSRFLLRYVPLERPLFILLLGMLFAVSFDTISQTLVFSWAASGLGGIRETLLVGLAFIIGMVLSDGTNGLWIARLISRADRQGVRISRTMGWTVVSLSLFVGLYILSSTLFPSLPLGTPILDTGIGLGVILCLSLSYMVVDMRIPPGQ